jgi:acetylornithine deacetylase
MTPEEQKALNAIDMDGMLAFLGKLISFPSLDGSEAEVQIQETVAGWMRENGMQVDKWNLDFDALRSHPAYNVEVDRERGLGVVGSMGKEATPSLIFNGHVDVVPADDPANWQYSPWEGTLVGGKVFGRGAVDMKGGLCCALFAAKAIRDSGVGLKGRLIIESVIGEEDGGVGTLACITRGYKADAAVILEPTRMIIAPSQAGALNFRITIPGMSAHGSMRTEGVSAIEKFILIHQALLDFEKQRNSQAHNPLFSKYPLPYAINIGNLHAGNWASSVPESLVCEGRFGVAVTEDVTSARLAFEEVVSQTAQADPWLSAHPPRVEWWGGQFTPAVISPQHVIVKMLRTAFQDVTQNPASIQGVPYGADMRLLVNHAETPTVLFGPGDVRSAHRPNEFIPISEMMTATRVLILTALRMLGTS